MERFGELLCGFDLSGVEISAEIYAESVTPDNIDRIGFVTHCDIGLQTIAPQASEAVGRPWRQDRFEQGYHLLKKAGKELNCSMIVGLPGETLESFIAGMNYVEEELEPYRIMYNHLLLLRGTPLRHEAAKHGIVYDPVPPYPVRQTSSMPETDLKKALALAGQVMQSGRSRRRHANPDY
jgi:coproporphyrinogen III oxidase-like Fe-S oxidoreductase